jgi:3-oxoacyl-[acyl-carrier protein] reductase
LQGVGPLIKKGGLTPKGIVYPSTLNHQEGLIMQKLRDKIAIITGGGTGIGKAACLDFAKNGAHVVIIENIEANVNSVAEEISAL